MNHKLAFAIVMYLLPIITFGGAENQKESADGKSLRLKVTFLNKSVVTIDKAALLKREKNVASTSSTVTVEVDGTGSLEIPWEKISKIVRVVEKVTNPTGEEAEHTFDKTCDITFKNVKETQRVTIDNVSGIVGETSLGKFTATWSAISEIVVLPPAETK